jgi:hypothetical protein
MESTEFEACDSRFASNFSVEECDGDDFSVGFAEEDFDVVEQGGEYVDPFAYEGEGEDFDFQEYEEDDAGE